MPLNQTSGNATADSFGGGVAAIPNYIEDVFSTYLYTGNDSTQTITNNIDLSTKGGLVWLKNRSNTGGIPHVLYNTVTGGYMSSNTTGAEGSGSGVIAATTSGFSLSVSSSAFNALTNTYASWTFRKQPKFFDVVTYTGTGAVQNISHNLGSAPGFMIVKSTTSATNWAVYHRSLGATKYLLLNGANAVDTATVIWNDTAPTSTQFTVGTNASINGSGQTFVAYLFAHDAGGFGLTGTDNVISCGSYTGNAAAEQQINLGYEAQWVLIKRTDSAIGGNWQIYDTMRGIPVNGSSASLVPNLSDAEGTSASALWPNATGFSVGSNNNTNGSARSYIYIAIRRGPMKVPTDGTKVFAPTARTGTGAAATVTGIGFTPDLLWSKARNAGNAPGLHDRLRGTTKELLSNSTAVEYDDTSSVVSINMDGYSLGTDGSASGTVNVSGTNYGYWNFKRAPSFFDEVCYTGTGTAGQTFSHNLGVAPELMIVKCRSTTGEWRSYSSALTATKWIVLNTTAAAVTGAAGWNNTEPTASVFSVGNSSTVNGSGTTYVAYLFATCPGVSKVGSYTGNGSTQAIACGFTGGARFVLIKRTDSTGGWYVYDTARGMTLLTDPYLFLNSTAAESATLGSVTTTTGGFTVDASILAAINTNAATYIFLAIA